jgi:hypothetical protein
MLSSLTRRIVMSSIVLILVVSAYPASAEVRPGSFEFELYGGWYDAGPGVLGGSPTLGGRFGYNATPRFFVQGGLGYTKFESSLTNGDSSGTATVDLWNMDFSFGYNFTEDSNVTPEVHAGFGGGFGTVGGALQINDPDVCGVLSCTATFENLSEDSFTLHGGAGVRIDLGDLIYVRPVIQARWFGARDDDEWDVEYSVSLGFKFGGN